MSSPLVRLRFIHFAAWYVVGRWPGAAPGGRRPRPSLLFVADFDGDDDEYLAAFGLAVPRGMRLAFGAAEGFPGPQPTRGLIDYVDRHRLTELLRFSAYPGATMRDVDAALAVADLVDDLRWRGDGDDDAFVEARCRQLLDLLALAPAPTVPGKLRGAWMALRPRSTVAGITLATPVAPDRLDEVVARVRALAAGDASPFAGVAGMHTARVAVVPAAGDGDGGAGGDDGRADDGPNAAARPYLFVTAWCDRAPGDLVDRLVAGLGEHADAIWSGCLGYPGLAGDPAAVAAWLGAHRLRPALVVCARTGASVARVRSALALRERLLDVATATPGCPEAAVRDEVLRPPPERTPAPWPREV